MADYNYQAPPPNSNMALFSLIASITGLSIFPLIGSIVGIILGFMAKKEIRESMGALGGDTMATIGLVIGFIGVGIGLIFCCIMVVSFLFPFLMVGGMGLSGELFITAGLF